MPSTPVNNPQITNTHVSARCCANHEAFVPNDSLCFDGWTFTISGSLGFDGSYSSTAGGSSGSFVTYGCFTNDAGFTPSPVHDY